MRTIVARVVHQLGNGRAVENARREARARARVLAEVDALVRRVAVASAPRRSAA